MRFIVTAALWTVLGATLAVAATSPSESGSALIEEASTKMNIFDLPSFRMDATVRIANQGKPLDGTYSLLWNGPEQWREEITFPGYSEVQVGRKGMVYTKRTTTVMPYAIFQVRSTIGVSPKGSGSGSFLRLGPREHETIKKVHKEKVGNSKADCVEFVSDQKSMREACVDEATGMITREKQGFVDTELTPVATKVFPRSMVLVENQKPVVELHITDFQVGEPLASALFEPPTDAVSTPWCMNAVSARLIHRVEPRYPEQDKASLHQGMVAIYVLVDKTGVPQKLQVIRSAGASLEAASLDAVRQWRYEPPTCNGQPVETEGEVEIRFSFQ